jgi:hypothetical protein
LSIVVAIVIVITPAVLGVIGLLGGELYARHRATSVLAKVVECVAEDRACVVRDATIAAATHDR